MKPWLNAIFLLTIMSGHSADASMSDYGNQGKNFGKVSLPGKPTNTVDVPHFQGDNVPEAKLKYQDLAGKSQSIASQSLQAQLIEESIVQRPQYTFDPTTDPLFTTSDQIVNNPLQALDVTDTEGQEVSQKTIHTCIEGRNEIKRSCISDLIVTKTGYKEELRSYTIHLNVLDIIQHPDPMVRSMLIGFSDKVPIGKYYKGKRYRQVVYRSLNPDEMIQSFKQIYGGMDLASDTPFEFNPEQIRQVKPIALAGGELRLRKHRHGDEHAKQYCQFEVTVAYQTPTYETEWKSTCDALEKLVDEGKCSYQSKQCTQGAQTRTIKGMSISQPCWQEQRFYICDGVQKDTCTPLRKKGCYQIASKCIHKEQNDCLEYEQTFECVNQQGLKISTFSGPAPYCLDGSCVEQDWAPNQDMADSLSKLSLFKEIQKDMDAKTQTVFKGKDLKCSRTMTNFKDCCVKKGWGMNVGLAGCNGEEKELAEQRKSDKCIRLGTYCAEKVLGKCVQKKTSFCCFGSKLARLIHEQGRKQLGLTLGSAKHPQCQGLTLDQITKIDFSKIDLSELFKDILSKTKVPVMSRITQGISDSMRERTRFQTNKEQNITQGRSRGNF